MKQFKDLGITSSAKNFVGEKIKIERLLNKEIIVMAFRIEPSKYQQQGKCLWMQIEIAGEKRVLFSASGILIEMISKVPDDGFPFKTTIVKINDHFEFS